MSTQPNPPTTLWTSIEPHWVHNYAVFIKAHEKLLAIVALAAFGFYGYSKGIDAWDRHEQRLDNIAQQNVDAAHQQNADLVKQLADLKTSVDARAKASDAQIAALRKELSDRQAIDHNLPMPELGQRWSELLSLPPGEVTPAPDNKMLLTENASHVTVNELEKVPVLVETVVQREAELAGCNQVRAKQEETIAGKDKEIVAVNDARTADAKLAKAAQKKAWKNGFKWGFGAGAAAVVAVRIFLHI
jgi:hypothetical protein